VISAPAKCKRGLKIIKELGRGDVGIAYEIEPGAQANSISTAMNPDGKYVLKEVRIANEHEMRQFSSEICIGKYLGELKIAPRIYDCWVCAKSENTSQYPVTGYYIMDKMEKIWDKEYPSNSDNKIPLRPAPLEMEKKLVKVLETMVKAGIIHQDCHPGNIGILKDGRVVLFDFGFAIFSHEKMTQPETILMSQLYMVLEHYDKPIMYDSYLYDVIYQIRQNKYKIAV
jgi:tRNA A-37 threonylcarbamoyl transferase component Bud32